MVLSLWRDNVCTGSFRLAVDEVPDADRDAARGLAAAYDAHRAALPGRRPAGRLTPDPSESGALSAHAEHRDSSVDDALGEIYGIR